MDVTVTLVTGGGRKANRESYSYTIKEVQTEEQVREMFHERFGQYFRGATTLTQSTAKAKAKKE